MIRVYNSRKNLCIILLIIAVLVFTMTIAYAALSTVLNIVGNAEVYAANWDIHLDNIILNENSATSTPPTITSPTTASFTTTLNKPGDYYQFTIDVVNDGSIDAMIDGISKMPNLTEEQAKYINYIIEYENGQQINFNQTVQAGSFVRIKVLLEYRKDISVSDLPNTPTTLELSMMVNYVQSNENATNVGTGTNKIVKIVSGDLETVGSEVCIKDECFYVLAQQDELTLLFAKYNLYLGYYVSEFAGADDRPIIHELPNPTGLQHPDAIGIRIEDNQYVEPIYGTIPYSYEDTATYNESYLKQVIVTYGEYISNFGLTVYYASVLDQSAISSIQCDDGTDSCIMEKYSWLFSTSYWTNMEDGEGKVMGVVAGGGGFYADKTMHYGLGARPMILLKTSELLANS